MSARRERQRRRRRSKGGPGRIIFLALGVITAGIAIGVLSFVGYVVSIATSGPSLSDLRPKPQGSNSIIYARDGTQLAIIPADRLRTEIPSRLMPRVMRRATVAIEDKRFYKHGGVDFEGVVRAAIKNFENKKTVQGGSTLTMQLIKNLYTEDRSRDYKRKIREAKLAEELEDVHPGKAGKEWILTKYINNVPYGTVGGQTAYGVQAAARVFFNKRARDLTLPEAALLAGLPQAPSDYNPFSNPDRARERRAEVLEQMRDAGYVTAAEEAEANAAPLGVNKDGAQYYRNKREAYFVDYVRNELIRQYGLDTVREGGLRVYTTIDLKAQEKARKAILGDPRVGDPGQPEGAIVSIDPKTGWIKAMATSQTYSESKFNIASQGKRQPGSTAKMLVLMTALKRNIDIKRTHYVSHPLNFTWNGTKIDVQNSDRGKGGGSKSLFQAVVSSDNTIFQQLDLDLGPENVAEVSKEMGVTSKLEGVPAEAIGGMGYCCTPLEMARAYTTIGDGGVRKKPIAITKVRFPSGKVSHLLSKTKEKRVFTDGQTYEAIQAMKANVASGTGTAANVSGCPTAGKTGTTDSFKDAWFAGMTSNLVTVVWVGHSAANLPMPGMFGGTAPASIFHSFMESAVNKKTCKEWPQPKTPFIGEPFFGEFAVGGSRAPRVNEDDETTTTPVIPQEQNGEGTGRGGAVSPDAYETPPVQIQPDDNGTGVGTAGGAAPGNGVGNGQGNGNGNNGNGNGPG
ncbi:MAG TPA: transglycosylase domain-containing protein [Solirubrobacteraceae bacterium]